MIGDQLYFNNYQTAKYLGKQIVEYPLKAAKLLKDFIKFNLKYYPQIDYLLIDIKGKHFSTTQLNQRINKIFGKICGINNIRHEYLTDKYKDVNLKEMKEKAEAMGKSGNVEGVLEYVKK